MKTSLKPLKYLLILICYVPALLFAGNIPSTVRQQPGLAPMLKRIMPAVVNVSAQITVPMTNYPPYKGGNHPQQQPNDNDPRKPFKGRFESVGSGVIVDAQRGFVLTNAHLVAKADSINVSLSDNRHFKAKLVGIDPPSDIAVIQIPPENLHALVLGDSAQLNVGDYVLAIGNPFGLSQTVTSGIISALQRANLNIEGYENFIQTDAAINTGNSGGALVNLDGKLIGINTAILSTDGGNVGIGFAIPINMAKSVMAQLVRYGKVERGLLGVIVQNFTPALAEAFNIPHQQGAVITQVTPNSPASEAGLKLYDIIEKINGEPIQNASQVRNAIGVLRIGDQLKLQIRRDNQIKMVELTVGNPELIAKKLEESHPLLVGLDMRNFEQETAAHGRVKGIQILNVGEDTPADRIHLFPGDVIVAANRQPVSDLADLLKIANKNKEALLLHVYRGDGSLFLVLK